MPAWMIFAFGFLMGVLVLGALVLIAVEASNPDVYDLYDTSRKPGGGV